jgi:hypothetical protein
VRPFQIDFKLPAHRYSGLWERWYVASSGEWAEPKCDDAACELCAIAPERMLMR